MILEILAVIAVGVLIYVWLTYYNLSGIYLVRYCDPKCAVCMESKSKWDRLKTQVEQNIKANPKQVLTSVEFLEIDTTDTINLDTFIWESKYSPTFATTHAPVVVLIYDGEVVPYTGSHSLDSYEEFLMGFMFMKGLVNIKIEFAM
jgi:hypothetical protein